MNETSIKVIPEVTPCYGEILIAFGGMMLSVEGGGLLGDSAREEIIEYLLREDLNACSIQKAIYSEQMQKIMHKHSGRELPFIGAIKPEKGANNGEPVEITLVSFFKKSIWPIIVKHYITNVNHDVDIMKIRIRIEEKTYSKFYSDVELNTFFNELKQLFLYNYIVIASALVERDGELALNILLPVPPIIKFGF